MKFDELGLGRFEKDIKDTEYLNEIIPAKGGFLIEYGHYYKDGSKGICIEVLSKDKKTKLNIDLLSEEKVSYQGVYRITHVYARMYDCKIVAEKDWWFLCDKLVIISDQASTERSSDCDIF